MKLALDGEVAGQRLEHPDLVLSTERLSLDGVEAERHRDQAEHYHRPLHVSHADSPLVDRECFYGNGRSAASRLMEAERDNNRSVQPSSSLLFAATAVRFRIETMR